MFGSETAETNLRTLLLSCYLHLLGVDYVREQDCGDESAHGAVTMLFGAVGVQLLGSKTAETNLRTLLLPCELEMYGSEETGLWSLWSYGRCSGRMLLFK